MSMRRYTNSFNTRKTPQSEPIPGREKDMAKNNAGGFDFKIDKWSQLDRFLILGTESGSYYASSKKMTADNAKVALDCVAEDGVRVVNRVVEISQSGRAPKNDPALFVLALCLKLGDDNTRAAARAAVPKVARIGTHLFHFADAIEAFGGWGRGTRKAISEWYTRRSPSAVAFQAVKYAQRDGWSHRDLLRLAHVKPPSDEHNKVFRYIAKGWPGVGELPPGDGTDIIWAAEKAKAIGNEGAPNGARTKEIVRLITDHNLPRECIPTQYLNEIGVWEALLDNGGRGMPMTAMIRNLPKMTSIGLLEQNSHRKAVVDALGNEEALRKARVHPLSVLVALKTYGSGHGVRGKLAWSPVPKVVDALDGAFYKSFGSVTPTGKRVMLALDVSGSMCSPEISGMPGITPRIGSVAMAMVTAAVEDDVHCIGFTSQGGLLDGHARLVADALSNYYGGSGKLKGFWQSPGSRGDYGYGVSELDISPRRRLDDNINSISNLPFGGTDCALPMLYAKANKIPVDAFLVFTDSETWHGQVHPTQALDQYKQAMGIDAKLIVVGMTSTGFSIADPARKDMLDVVGFDVAAPNIMSAFVRGEF